MLEKIISGGQTGADQAGLFVAKRFGLKTGGHMPKGWRTLSGPRIDFEKMFDMSEHHSPEYPPRTELNVKNSDGTVRLAGNFDSSGEKCTLAAIKKQNKPWFDVDLSDPPPPKDFVNWLNLNNIKTLNVAGNAESTFLRCNFLSSKYLSASFFLYGLEMKITAEQFISGFGIDDPLFGNLIDYSLYVDASCKKEADFYKITEFRIKKEGVV